MTRSSKVRDSATSAIADVPDGATIMFGGFVSAGTPATLIAALVQSGKRRLTGISNNIGFGDTLDNLCENEQLERMITTFAIRASGSRRSRFETLWRAGKVALELVPQGTLAERIRAGGAGIPAFYTPTGVGTVICEGKEVRRFGDRDYVLEHALRADFAFIRAHRADTFGNLSYRMAGRNFNKAMATAADVVIAEVDEIVEPGQLSPEEVDTPGVYVDRIIQAEARDVDWNL